MTRRYSDVISLVKNSRGIYSLDTVMGCKSGMENEQGGCYGDCYAANASKRYGYDFSDTVLRRFKDDRHRLSILGRINRIPLDFVRIGSSGDPSEDWGHTIDIIKGIETCNKEIVIITRHWTRLTDEQLAYFGRINVCVNTSVSALDKPHVRENCLGQYERLKPFCKSILRVVSCNFNKASKEGLERAEIQERLFRNDATLDTVFRPGKKNRYVVDGVINVSRDKFMNGLSLMSKRKASIYTGKCSTCHEMCGVRMAPALVEYPPKRGTYKQLRAFK